MTFRHMVILTVLVGLSAALPTHARPPAARQLFVRFKPLDADGLYARVQMTLHRSPWSIGYADLPRAGAGYARTRIKQNQYSAWAEVAPDWGTLTLDFHTDTPLDHPHVDIDLADAPDPAKVFKTIEINQKGSIVSLVLPRDYRQKPDGIITVAQAAALHLGYAKAAALPAAERPVKFPLLTSGAAGMGRLYNDPAVLHQELEALRSIGLNGLAYPDDALTMRTVQDLGFHFFMVGDDGSNPAFSTNARKLSATAFNQIGLIAVEDEPGNNGLSLIAQQPAEAFHHYLEAQGLKPEDFGVTAWTDVKPITKHEDLNRLSDEWGPKRGAGLRRMYYWSIRYSEHLTTDYFRNASQRVLKLYAPGATTFVNYTDHPLILGAGMLPGCPDWFEMGLQGATTREWSEDWMYGSYASWGNGLFQRIGFLCDLLRAAASVYHQPLGFYNCDDDGDAFRLKAMEAIGHGAKALHFFDYGPTYAATENFWSDIPSSYQGIAHIAHDLAASEDLVLPGQPPAAQVAIVYSTAAEIWDPSYSISQERQLLHIALEQEQYPADVINETLVLSRDLSAYKVIFVSDAQLPTPCAAKLKAWAEAGGLLVLMPQAGARDEYNQPASTFAGLRGAEVMEESGADADVQCTPAPDAGMGGQAVPVAIRLRRSAFTHVTGKTLATFADGSAAVTVADVGKGRCLSYAFMPGLNFFTQIGLANPKGMVQEFPAGARDFITLPCRLASVPRPVTISQPGVSANLLSSHDGSALVLVNFTRQDIPALQVRCNIPGMKRAHSVTHGDLATNAVDGALVFSLPVGLTDIVLLRP